MSEIDQQILEIQQQRKKKTNEDSGVALTSTGHFDTDIYGSDDRDDRYETSIPANDDIGDDDEPMPEVTRKTDKYIAPLNANVSAAGVPDFDPFEAHRAPRIADRENDYQQQRRKMILSPERIADPFADGGKTPDPMSRTFKTIMEEKRIQEQKEALSRQMIERAKLGELKAHVVGSNGNAAPTSKTDIESTPAASTPGSDAAVAKKRRWNQTTPLHGASEGGETPSVPVGPRQKMSTNWDTAATPHVQRWPETPARDLRAGGETPGSKAWAETPRGQTPGRDMATPGTAKRNRWDDAGGFTPGATPGRWGETPHTERMGDETPGGASQRRSRWDETPGLMTPGAGGATPGGATPSMATPMIGGTPNLMTPSAATPAGTLAMGMATPSMTPHLATPEARQAYLYQKEIDDRNRPLTDDELDSLLPPGYDILQPPSGYVPLRTPARKLLVTPTPMSQLQTGTPTGFKMQATPDARAGAAAMGMVDLQPKGENMPCLKPDDVQYFDSLLQDVDEDQLTPDQQRDRKILTCLLKIKNGTPPVRKAALRMLTDKAREFGAGPLFNQILPLMMVPTLEDQERHLLVKTIDRILYKLDDLVRPYVHKILVVIEPLLIEEDYYARVEGREIISNLAKAAGLAAMISTMRPDIDDQDEYVRNTTARAFAVVASALGIPALLPFLKAVCKSKKSWQARHTGIKIVQQIAILMGCAILPHLKSLVETIEAGLVDDTQKVRTITALALAALAEASTPYGIEAFDSVLKPLWKGIRQHRGKGLAAFLKAIGYLIPLMDAEYANYYTCEVMVILIREFQSVDDEMKKIVLKVVKQCCGTDGVKPQYIKEEILPPFFKHFWNHRMAVDKRNYRPLVDTTVEIAGKVGAAEIVSRVVDDLKDENEPYRKMVVETIDKVLTALGAAEIDARLEEQLIDGMLIAFQEQNTEDVVMLNGFGTVVNAFGKRVKPYFAQICGMIMWRINDKSAKVRQQSADLTAKIAYVLKLCQEENLMSKLSTVLYEYLGEEYPEVLGSILGALKAIVNVIGMNKMQPPIGDLLPRLTPILKNRHEKVQENCIELIGKIADRGADHVAPREWMRICFELLELLKAHKKSIRRAAVNTFGYIAKAIGPHDVLATLLNNLKVQERQNRICTTVAIAIVAESCAPYLVIPALMNEYRVPELNVQNGVLKSFSFMFEYIGEMARDYIFAVVPLLEDALMDRDLVHRQTAMFAVQHLAVGVFGYGCDEELNHLMNLLWPNVFETSPHICQAFVGCCDSMRLSLGPNKVQQYVVQGLFHPARKVRESYWRVYNTVYLGAEDQLVAGYPRVVDDSHNHYERVELDWIL